MPFFPPPPCFPASNSILVAKRMLVESRATRCQDHVMESILVAARMLLDRGKSRGGGGEGITRSLWGVKAHQDLWHAHCHAK